jgi:hypothetical protein
LISAIHAGHLDGPARERLIQAEIYANGPVQASMRVYDDFYHYRTGVYEHVAGCVCAMDFYFFSEKKKEKFFRKKMFFMPSQEKGIEKKMFKDFRKYEKNKDFFIKIEKKMFPRVKL